MLQRDNPIFLYPGCAPRYVHYEVDYTGVSGQQQQQQQEQESTMMMTLPRARPEERTILFPPQWIQCDLRFLDMSLLGQLITETIKHK